MRTPGLGRADETVVVAVRERAVNGAANAAIVRAIAAWLGVAKSAVVLERGETARMKRLRITGVSAAQLADALEHLPVSP